MACQDRKPCSTRWPGFGQQEGTENDMRVKKPGRSSPGALGWDRPPLRRSLAFTSPSESPKKQKTTAAKSKVAPNHVEDEHGEASQETLIMGFTDEETPKDEKEETPKDEKEETPKDEEETPKDKKEETPKDEKETPKDEKEKRKEVSARKRKAAAEVPAPKAAAKGGAAPKARAKQSEDERKRVHREASRRWHDKWESKGVPKGNNSEGSGGKRQKKTPGPHDHLPKD